MDHLPCNQILLFAPPDYQHSDWTPELVLEAYGLSLELELGPCIIMGKNELFQLFFFNLEFGNHVYILNQFPHSFKIGCALKTLDWASSISILRLSSISLCISSSCLTKLSSRKGSGFVHSLGSGFGGICIYLTKAHSTISSIAITSIKSDTKK